MSLNARSDIKTTSQGLLFCLVIHKSQVSLIAIHDFILYLILNLSKKVLLDGKKWRRVWKIEKKGKKFKLKNEHVCSWKWMRTFYRYLKIWSNQGLISQCYKAGRKTVYALRLTFLPKKASQKYGVERKMALCGAKHV